MSMAPAADPMLARIKAELTSLYGARLQRAVLFGSRARGEARDDSDYDVAVFLRDVIDVWPERNRLALLRQQLLNEQAVFLDAWPFQAGAEATRTLLMHEIRQDGVDL